MISNIRSNFAILDVLRGRKELREHFTSGGGPVAITIHGNITEIWGDTDGISQEFGVEITKLELPEQTEG